MSLSLLLGVGERRKHPREWHLRDGSCGGYGEKKSSARVERESEKKKDGEDGEMERERVEIEHAGGIDAQQGEDEQGLAWRD